MLNRLTLWTCFALLLTTSTVAAPTGTGTDSGALTTTKGGGGGARLLPSPPPAAVGGVKVSPAGTTAAAACATAEEGAAGAPTAADAGVVVVEPSRSRELASFTFFGDTTNANTPKGLVTQQCSSVPTERCKSHFYKVTGGTGKSVTATTCGTATFDMQLVVRQGNGTCAAFACVPLQVYDGCPGSSRNELKTWEAQAGAEYYVQIVENACAAGATMVGGTYKLTVSSDDPIQVSQVYGCQQALTLAPTNAPTDPPTEMPTEAPTDVPTEAPTEVPTGAPTDVPTEAPTEAPTDVPTEAPTEAPTASPTAFPTGPPSTSPTVADPCAGVGPAYWLYDPTTNAPIRRLVNNSATCLLHPYNLEVRPCNADIASNPVRVRLIGANGGSPLVVHKSKIQRSAPYFLFGPAATGSADKVLPSPEPLRNGVYYLAAKGAPEWGRLRFTQQCPCPDGTLKKGMGKKGCMK